MDLFNKILLDTNNVLTGYVLLIALLGGGIWFTIQTGFVQFREFGNGWRRVFGGLFKKKKNTSKEGGISSFQAEGGRGPGDRRHGHCGGDCAGYGDSVFCPGDRDPV